MPRTVRARVSSQRETLREAAALCGSTSVDFIDAWHAVEVRRRGLDRICSYDRDFDVLDGERVEPADVLR